VQPAVIIEPIGPAAYESEVLPASFSLWAYGRSFDRYAGDFRAFVASPYGKRRFATVGLRDGGRVAASCKAYAREIRWNEAILRATGIGAVFTPKALRGRGFASAMIGALLDRAGVSGIAANFVRLVAAKRRLFALSDMIRDYNKLYDAARGVTRAEVTSAAPLADDQVAALKDQLRGTAGKDVDQPGDFA